MRWQGGRRAGVSFDPHDRQYDDFRRLAVIALERQRGQTLLERETGDGGHHGSPRSRRAWRSMKLSRAGSTAPGGRQRQARITITASSALQAISAATIA